MTASGKVIDTPEIDTHFDFEPFFLRHYERLARTIARVVRDPARAEEIAAEAFWKLWRNPPPTPDAHAGWLYRTAIRLALDDLKKEARRLRRELQHAKPQPIPTPEQAHAANQERDRVRLILASLDPKQAGLLLLRSNDLTYAEVAVALDLNPASVGTLISRAQEAFRKEYVNQYGEPNHE